jgi:hypothetical protein
MHQVFVFKHIILGLESALNKVIGVIDEESKNLCQEGSNEEGESDIIGAKQITIILF